MPLAPMGCAVQLYKGSDKDRTIGQTVQYLHAAAGFPTKDTWTKAIKAGNYNTWPTITPTVVRRHFPESDKTQKGHMKRQPQGVRSKRVQEETEPNLPAIPKAKDIYIKIYNVSETIHTNQTGRFPATSSRGNQYVMVLINRWKLHRCRTDEK